MHASPVAQCNNNKNDADADGCDRDTKNIRRNQVKSPRQSFFSYYTVSLFSVSIGANHTVIYSMRYRIKINGKIE